MFKWITFLRKYNVAKFAKNIYRLQQEKIKTAINISFLMLRKVYFLFAKRFEKGKNKFGINSNTNNCTSNHTYKIIKINNNEAIGFKKRASG